MGVTISWLQVAFLEVAVQRKETVYRGENSALILTSLRPLKIVNQVKDLPSLFLA